MIYIYIMISYIIYGLSHITFFTSGVFVSDFQEWLCHSWKSSANHFTNSSPFTANVTPEKHWQITSRVTSTPLFTTDHISFHIPHTLTKSKTQKSPANNSIRHCCLRWICWLRYFYVMQTHNDVILTECPQNVSKHSKDCSCAVLTYVKLIITRLLSVEIHDVINPPERWSLMYNYRWCGSLSK